MNRNMIIAVLIIMATGTLADYVFLMIVGYVWDDKISAQTAMLIYGGFFLLYMFSFMNFYWQRAHKSMPLQEKRELIEHAFDNEHEDVVTHQRFVVSDEDFEKLLKTAHGSEVIITTTKDYALLKRNRPVEFAASDGRSVMAEVLSIRSDGTRVRRFS